MILYFPYGDIGVEIGEEKPSYGEDRYKSDNGSTNGLRLGFGRRRAMEIEFL
jgi:hypothetical protein